MTAAVSHGTSSQEPADHRVRGARRGVLAAIDAFSAGEPAADDITILAIGRLAG